MVLRYDVGRLAKAEPTPTGGARIPATVARTGIQIYRNQDGTEVREYRPPEEVFAPASLQTFANAAVTVGHPSVPVTAANWANLAVGHVSEAPPERADHEGEAFVAVPLVLSEGAAIAKADAGDLSEVSVGYAVDIDETPGVTPAGERYDRVQRNIRVNHVALGRSGFARAGRNATLRLDGNQTTGEHIPMKIRFDGVEYDKGSDAHIRALENAGARASLRADELEAENGELTAKLDSANEAAKKAAEIAPAAIDAAIAFRDDARKLVGADYDFAGKSDDTVRREALGKVAPQLNLDGKADAFVAAAYEIKLQDADTTDHAARADSSDKPAPARFDSQEDRLRARLAPKGDK